VAGTGSLTKSNVESEIRMPRFDKVLVYCCFWLLSLITRYFMNNFLNDRELQKLLQAEIEYDEDVERCVGLITNEFSMQAAPCPSIEAFLLYRSFNEAGVVQTYNTISEHPETAIYQISYSWSLGGTKSVTRYYAQCFLALLHLPREYPSTCILKETLQTRVNDWFARQDVDFERQEKFSNRFHMVTHDRIKLEFLLKDRPLDELIDFPLMEAEIHGQYCLLKVSNDPASEYDLRQLIELTKKMYKVFS
jgi:hypothetical protein